MEVVGFVDDTRYSGQGSLWGSLETWREVARANRPGPGRRRRRRPGPRRAHRRGEGASRTRSTRPPAETTDTLTLEAATEALPGVSQQRATFNQIIGVTVVIALVVVALFFALITVERTALYGILKAVGASGATLFAGVVTQAVVVTLVASAIGAGAALGLDALIPPGSIPFDATVGRLVSSVVLLLVASVLGCAFSLRRVLRIDPASAIG